VFAAVVIALLVIACGQLYYIFVVQNRGGSQVSDIPARVVPRDVASAAAARHADKERSPAPTASARPVTASQVAPRNLPPSALFAGIVALQRDPEAKLGQEQSTTVAGALKKIVERASGAAIQKEIQTFAGILSDEQLQILRKAQPDKSAKGDPLTGAIATVKSVAADATPMAAADKKVGEGMQKLPMQFIIGIAQLQKEKALSPEQAAAILPALEQMREAESFYLEQADAIIKSFNEKQREIVAKAASAGQAARAEDALIAIEKGPDAIRTPAHTRDRRRGHHN
jgi:hypothetical protein